ncbi:hypothetical protein [Parasitella parasitica]|uniref:Uncharacterized protein n=1 Tax=Parasitella parasitica TaxID=35722 RepID=A0A0B7NC16_9FUNG|nr:hypothetical protein [Parasitella parasitica]
MTSIQPASFFNQKTSRLARKVTFRPIHSTADSKLVKNNLTSKVKRLGSLLVGNTKSRSSATDTLTIIPSTSALSLESSTTHEDSDEEHIATPNALTTEFKGILTIPNDGLSTVNQMEVNVASVTPKDQSNQPSVMVVETIKPSTEEQTLTRRRVASSLEKRDPNNRKPLSDVFMVIHQLRMAFEEIDNEIDEKIEYDHLQMLNSIIMTPRTLC